MRVKEFICKKMMENLIWDMQSLGARENSGTLLQSKHRWERGRVSRMRGMVDTVKSWSEVGGREKAGRIVFKLVQKCRFTILSHSISGF